jgi:hypothetical protein
VAKRKQRIPVAKAAQAPQPAAIRDVTISTAGIAAPLSVPVIRRNRDIVKWRAASGGGPWRITFDKGDGTPFDEPAFDVPTHGSVVTREARGTAAPGRYRYKVRHGTSPFGVTHDPDVDIE